MKKSSFLAVVALSVLAVGSVWAQDVRYNFDKNTNFTNFKTYKWVEMKEATKVNDIMDKNIKTAVDAQLITKGLSKVEDDSADLYIGYQAAVGQEKQFTSYDTGWGYGSGYGRAGWYGGGMQSSTTTGSTSTIYIGQVAVDMYDSKNKDLVWRGVASKTLDQKAKPEKQEKNLNKAMAKLMKNYPPVVK